MYVNKEFYKNMLFEKASVIKVIVLRVHMYPIYIYISKRIPGIFVRHISPKQQLLKYARFSWQAPRMTFDVIFHSQCVTAHYCVRNKTHVQVAEKLSIFNANDQPRWKNENNRTLCGRPTIDFDLKCPFEAIRRMYVIYTLIYSSLGNTAKKILQSKSAFIRVVT